MIVAVNVAVHHVDADTVMTENEPSAAPVVNVNSEVSSNDVGQQQEDDASSGGWASPPPYYGDSDDNMVAESYHGSDDESHTTGSSEEEEEEDDESDGSDDDLDEENVDSNPLTFDFHEHPVQEEDARVSKSCELFCLVQEQNLTRETHNKLIKLFNKWMQNDDLCTYLILQRKSYHLGWFNIFVDANRQALYSPYLTEKLMTTHSVKSKLYRVCPKGCRMFPPNSTENCSCGEPQFKEGTANIPIKTMSYFPLAKQLSAHVADLNFQRQVHEYFVQQYATSANNNAATTPSKRVYKDITNGSVYQNLRSTYFTESTNLSLGLFIDGFTLTRGAKVSLTIVHVVILSLPPTERYIIFRLKYVAYWC